MLLAKNKKKQSAFTIITDHKDGILLWKDNGMWTLPGGTVEAGETKKQAAQREVLEEVGVKIKKLKKFAVYHNYNNHDNSYYEAQECSSKIAKAFEAKKIKFFKPRKLPDFLPLKHRQAILDFYNNKHGWLIERKTDYPTTKEYRKHYKPQEPDTKKPKGRQIILAY